MVAEKMGPVLGQSMIVENRPGATGTIGAANVATAAADGYTLLMGTVSNIALAPSFYPVKYDPVTSFTPIGMVANVPLVLVASPSLGASNYAQLIAAMKSGKGAKGGGYAYSSPGFGGPQHLAGVLLQKQIDTPLLHVPYKSGGAAITAVASGETQLAFAGIPAAASLAQAKKVVPLFVTSNARMKAMPDVASASEAGFPGMEIDNWHALFAPAALPAEVQAKLEAALIETLEAPALKTSFLGAGAEAAPGTGKALGATVAAETARWKKVITDNKLKADQ
ncbi:Bug family tripartite tricarboxylate transporter substrate binding protein [Bordetella holmesii]|uniref:Bug family tripartite tricarboxylate transporter substrate binding protein n=1 Tax=Bordetella holmesii TaxID=35814 RepID=UPI0012988284|nr:tripartite tricarboxylate transporter substrate binding protein [Bordetella holmesii]QGB06337.1 tripartite tricarboxylate transporter substrate binding protein [Bordetella holmesii]QGB13743.1 tripartite tricarboxylate transporter substrate binding protein [Bordetella holmesii]QGC41533.1 tripartite tricarboxylate transporter substrate binding protein [Bordetella holmesii]QJP51957.1 tripartite tricarboxylate transporter substrate binding protein [Bordetella holmesii]